MKCKKIEYETKENSVEVTPESEFEKDCLYQFYSANPHLTAPKIENSVEVT